MTSLLEILRACAWIVLAAVLVGLCRLRLKDVDIRRMKARALFRLPASVRWALAVLALAGFFVAGGKPGGTNGTDRAGASARTVRRVASGPVEGPQGVVTDADVAAGWRVVSVSSNAFDASVFAMPTNAVVWEDARVCGAGFGAWRMPAGWRFPFAGPAWTNAFLWVEGLFRARFDDRSDEIRLLDERLTLCPEANWPRYGLPASRAWAAVDGNGGLVATFENAALVDDPAKIVSAQLALDPARAEVALRYDLRAAGAETRLAGLVAEGVFRSVAVGSNTSEVVFRRVHPDDWDWDGLPDTLDDEPHVPRADGPVWGQSAEWACLAFPSNAAEIAAAGGYLAWAAARGGEPNRHLVGLAIESPDDVWPVSVRFGGLQVMCDRAETLYFAIDDGAKYAFELSEGRLRSVTVGDEDRVDGLWEDWFQPWEWCVWPTFVTVHMDSARTGWIERLPDVAVEGLDYAHFFPGDSLAVTARVENCHADSLLDCSWSSPDPGVSFSDVQGLGTVITWQNPGGVVWATNRVTLVTTYAGDYAVTNGYTVSVGPSPNPATTLEVSCPAVQFLNDGTGEYDRDERVYPVSVTLLGACGTEGRLSLADAGGTLTRLYHDRDRQHPVSMLEGLPLDIPASGGYTAGRTFYMTSAGLGRGTLRASFAKRDAGGTNTAEAAFQVIEPIRKLVTTERAGDGERFVNPSRLVWGTNAVLKVSVNLAEGTRSR